jgi:hypothetical protein
MVDTALLRKRFNMGKRTMRGLLVLLGIVILAGVVAMSLGMLKVDWPKDSWPAVHFSMQAKMPTVSTGTVSVGTTNTTVAVPKVEMTNTTVQLPTLEVKPAASPTPAPAN